MLSTRELGGVLCLPHAGNDARYDAGECVCSIVDVNRSVFVSEEEVASHDRASMRP
jgi:hypothetical protein